MTTDERFDRTVAEWLHEDARHRLPDHLVDVLGRTSRTRQRPWWSSHERWLPMDLTTRANAFAPPRVGRALVIVVLLVALLAAALLVVGSRSRVPAPFGPAANGTIAFSNGGDIYVSDGASDPRLLIGGSSVDVGPLYSNDGTRIAFLRQVSDTTLRYMLVRADGTDLKTLTREPLQDPDNWDWSPDGSRLVVMHAVGGFRVLSIVPTDGSDAIRRLDLGAIEPEAPAWRPPDGREIVFRGKTDAGRSSAIYAISADGTGLHPVTPILHMEDAYAWPRLSPDGAFVTYTNFSERDDSPDGQGGHAHVLDLRIGTEHRVAVDPSVAYESEPQFSPDGSLVLYRRYGLDVPMRLMLAPTAGSGPAHQVGPAQDADGDYVIAFSPDGTKLFVFDRKATPWQIITIADGSVAYGPAVDDWAHWQRLALPSD